MSRIISSGGGWTRVTYRHPCIFTLVLKASGNGSTVGWNCCPGHDVAGVDGARGSVRTSGAGEFPRLLNTVTLRQILGMAQQGVTGFE